jgi:hypothetical protein
LKGLLRVIFTRIVYVQKQVYSFMTFHDWPGFFKEGKGIEYKKICQWAVLIPVQSLKRQVTKEAFKYRNLLLVVIEKGNVFW